MLRVRQGLSGGGSRSPPTPCGRPPEDSSAANVPDGREALWEKPGTNPRSGAKIWIGPLAGRDNMAMNLLPLEDNLKSSRESLEVGALTAVQGGMKGAIARGGT